MGAFPAPSFCIDPAPRGTLKRASCGLEVHLTTGLEERMNKRQGTRFRISRWLTKLGLVLLIASSAVAQESRTLIVGTKEAAPFSFRAADGQWRGISIDLWRSIAEDLALKFELQEAPLHDLLEGLGDGRFDVAVAAFTVTAEREQVVDFSHPFHPSGLGIAVPVETSGSLRAILDSVLSVGFLQAVGTLLAVLFLGGTLLWLLERKKNPEQFGGSITKGLGTAFWRSAVTMTTVGYGDKAPITLGGRVVAIIWMFASIIMISGLTAAIASTLTVSNLELSVSSPRDLPSLSRIACVEGSTGEEYLRSRRLPYLPFPNATEAVQSLSDGNTQAVVYDAPILRYLTMRSFQETVTVLPVIFERQDYAIALPLHSALRKSVNTSLLKHVSGEDWHDVLYKYLGANQ